MHPLCIMLMGEMAHWSISNGMPFVITETFTTAEEDLKLNRISATHREARAFDISTREWTDDKIKDFQDFFNTKYESIAAVSSTTGGPTLVIYHNAGTGNHFHVQISKNYAITTNIQGV
jgi:hypothetical protein